MAQEEVISARDGLVHGRMAEMSIRASALRFRD